MAKLYFYYAAMNAGKTTILLQSNYNYHERGMNTLLFSPVVDTRSGLGKIVSRIGLENKAINFDVDFDFFKYVEARQEPMMRCIFIDEAHFLKKPQVKQLKKITEQLGIPVLAYGLRTDYMGEPFEGSTYLLAFAENLVEIKTICHCGKKATMNLRVDKQGRPVREGEQIVIGGNDQYIAVCYKHFVDI
jgi:thymidine kinase